MNNYSHPDPLIAAAVARAWETHPYYASAIDRLRIVADPNVPTMATSAQWVTHYNPETLKSWTPDERAAVLVHELEHLLRRHSERCGDRDPQRWNVAADAEINQRLAGLPDGAVYPETLGMPRGRTAELYYGVAQAQAQAQPQPQPGGSGDGDGNGSGSAGSGSAGSGQCGSAAGGPTQAHEQGDARNPGPGAAQADEARKEIARNVLGGLQPGTDPGDELREWAERELGIDRAAWYTALASAVGTTMAPYGAPTRWIWPGRRDARDIGGAMVPRWTGERPSCAVVIDTSSSITPMDIEMGVAAAHYIARVADVTYYACDTRPVRLGSQLPAQLPGGGGTDLRRGIALAIREGARAVVVITDCQTPWATEPYSVPIIVGANPGADAVLHPARDADYYRQFTPPDWMTVLPIVAHGDE